MKSNYFSNLSLSHEILGILLYKKTRLKVWTEATAELRNLLDVLNFCWTAAAANGTVINGHSNFIYM